MTDPNHPEILCLGAMMWDVIGHASAALSVGEDAPGRIHQRPGGVALNVAIALAALGLSPAILSAVGRDAPGQALIEQAGRLGVRTDWLHRDASLPTDLYMVIETPQGLMAAIADVHALEAAGTAILLPLRDGRLGDASRPWRGTMIVDGNLTPAVLTEIAHDPCLAHARLRIVPASPDKAPRLRLLLGHPQAVFHINRLEAEALAERLFPSAQDAAVALVAEGAARVIVTDSARPAADAAQGQPTLIRTPPQVAASHVTGAGDAFLAAHLAAELDGLDRGQALDAAIRAASIHITRAPQAGAAHSTTEKDTA